MGELIAVLSGKGGTGKTSVCAGLSTALAEAGTKVLCIDCDVGLRNLDISLGMAELGCLSFEDVCIGSYTLEQIALERALTDPEALGLEGLVLLEGDEILAFTMGSQMRTDTFDVHFEKAREDVDGAYPTINQQFAFHIREKHPQIRFLDREDDMGLEGLRKAKLSYYPAKLLEKYWACLLEDGYDY